MTEAPETSWRACCSARATDPLPPLFPADRELTAGPALVLPPRQRTPSEAVHEGGHAVVGIALRWRVRLVSIDGASRVEWEPTCRAPRESAVVALAGPLAENWAQRRIVTASTAAVTTTLSRVRTLCAGMCDDCLCLRAVAVEVGRAPDLVAIRRFREIERFTLAAIRLPEIWGAVTALAGALMEHGTLNGDEAAELCSDFFKPGRLSAPALKET